MTSKYKMWERVQERHACRAYRSTADQIATNKFDLIEFWQQLEEDQGVTLSLPEVWQALIEVLKEETK